MAIISIINKSYILRQLEHRFEPDYFEPRFLDLEKKLGEFSNTKVLNNLVDFYFGSTYSSKMIGSHGIRILKIGDITRQTREYQWDRVDFNEFIRLKGNIILNGDILMTLTGDPPDVGKVILVDNLEEKATNNQRTVIIRPKRSSGLTQYNLFALINSDIVRFQIERIAKGIRQRNVGLEGLKKVKIPITSSILERLDTLVKIYLKYQHISMQSYLNATDILYEALGLKKWTLSEAKCYVKKYSEVIKEKRMDSLFFHPRYDELLKLVKNNACCWKTVGDIKSFNSRGVQPNYVYDGQLKVINSQHILNEHLDFDNLERTDIGYWDIQTEARVYRNDILTYTTGAYVGRTNIYLEDEKSIGSNHVNILRINGENSIYVGFLLNSMVGRLQTEKFVSGSAQVELYPSDIEKFVIPFIEDKKQETITELVNESYSAIKIAKVIVDITKKTVKTAVEENDKTALEFLEHSYNKISNLCKLVEESKTKMG